MFATVHVGKYSDTKWWPSETARCIQHAKAACLCKNVKIHSDMNWWPWETVPLCPAILPKIIWRCQTEKRGSKKFMQYDGWCQFAKKLPLLPNKRIWRVCTGECLFRVTTILDLKDDHLFWISYTLKLALKLHFWSYYWQLICYKPYCSSLKI